MGRSAIPLPRRLEAEVNRSAATSIGSIAVVLAFALAAACDSGGSDPGAASPDVDGGTEVDDGDAADALADDPDPVFTDGERAALATLSPAELPPPPPDPTNAFADDPKAIAFGKTLFFDPSFSGKLLDGDNDGSEVTLGKRGESGKVSCAGCHLPNVAFADGRSRHRQLSLASRWSHRRTPSLLDVAQARFFLWDGRRDSLFSQVFDPLEANEEMNTSRLFVAERVHSVHRAAYEAVFGAMPPLDEAVRFPPLSAETTGCRRIVTDAGTDDYEDCHGKPGDQAEYDGMSADDREAVTRVVANVGKAIGAYERTLACGAGRFDAWQHGDEAALTREQKRGAAVFVGKGRCTDCHSGPFMSDQRFHVVGMKPVVRDPTFTEFLIPNDPGASEGRKKLLADPLNSASPFSDESGGHLAAGAENVTVGGFKTPTLRCVARRPSFMHTGQLHTLEDVIELHDSGGDRFGYAGTNELLPLGLSPRERADLAAFLRALDGTAPVP